MLFESELDRNNEHKVITKVKELWRCDVIRTDTEDHMDYYIINPNTNVNHPVEIKCRTTPKDRYVTFFVDHKKWLTGKRIARETNTRFILFVGFSDGLYWSNETNKTDTGTRFVDIGGRTDRNTMDLDQVIHIPHKELILMDNNMCFCPHKIIDIQPIPNTNKYEYPVDVVIKFYPNLICVC